MTYMFRFFIASRLASGRDLFFEIACSHVSRFYGFYEIVILKQMAFLRLGEAQIKTIGGENAGKI